MSNTIQIKRGAGKPDEKLAPYELGIDIVDGQLYYGGSLTTLEDGVTKSYGDAQGIKVAQAVQALGAKSIISNNGEGLTMGNVTTPIFIENGEFRTCGGSSISGTIEQANMLSTPREIGVDLAKDTYASFNGQQNIVTGTTGILPVDKGGTGASSLAAAGIALAKDFLPLTGGTLKVGNSVLGGDRTDSNSTSWGITISSLYGLAPDGNNASISNAPVNWSTGVKFYLASSEAKDERYAAIAGYAATSWANTTGLRFITTTNSAGSTTDGIATFTSGVFSAPYFAVLKGYGESEPSGVAVTGQLYFQVI